MEFIYSIILTLKSHTYFNNSLFNYIIALLIFLSIVIAITIFIFIIGVGGFTAARNPAGGTAFQRSRQVFWLVLAAMRLPENYPVSSRFRGNGGRHKTLSCRGRGGLHPFSGWGDRKGPPCIAAKKKDSQLRV